MNKDELKQYLKDNLKIKIENDSRNWEGDTLEVYLYLEDEKISNSYVITNHWRDN